MHLVLYQPDIPQNVGSALRLCACLDVPVHIVEPCGFIFDDKRLRRAGMDYIELANLSRHRSWEAFSEWRETQNGRLILLTTKATGCYLDMDYRPDDLLMVGRESAGVPQEIAESADLRVLIPMREGARSLNVITAAAMVLGEGLRQTRRR